MKDLRYNVENDNFQWLDNEHGFRCSGNLKLMVIKTALNNPHVFRLIWNTQDGYGVAGYTPPQGYDWSGIRDSSKLAVHNMYQVALNDKEAFELNEKLVSLKKETLKEDV